MKINRGLRPPKEAITLRCATGAGLADVCGIRPSCDSPLSSSGVGVGMGDGAEEADDVVGVGSGVGVGVGAFT